MLYAYDMIEFFYSVANRIVEKKKQKTKKNQYMCSFSKQLKQKLGQYNMVLVTIDLYRGSLPTTS